MADQVRAKLETIISIVREAVHLDDEAAAAASLDALRAGKILTTDICAQVSGSSSETVRRRCQERDEEGESIGVKLGNVWLIPREKWLQEIEGWKGRHARLEAETALRKWASP